MPAPRLVDPPPATLPTLRPTNDSSSCVATVSRLPLHPICAIYPR